jgi:hypothetical protein
MSVDAWVDAHRVSILALDGLAIAGVLIWRTVRASGDFSGTVEYMNAHREGRRGIDPEKDAKPVLELDPEMATHMGDDRPEWMDKD